MLTLSFYGGCGEVTGSCYLLKVGEQQLLIDCGLIQGQEEDELRNFDPFPFDARFIDAVVLTHAHLDHSGRLPLLVQRGFRGPIYCHHGTLDLCNIMLRDAAHIHEMEAEKALDQRHYRRHQTATALYTMPHAEAALELFTVLPYESKRDILPGVAIRLRDAGHILGAAIVEIWLEAEGVKRKLVFSGDLGHTGAPVMCEPTTIEKADLVIMESTYGDSLHPDWDENWNRVAAILQQAEWDHGNVVIPSFAVGRTQDLLYQFSRHYDAWKMDRWQVYLDSPLAIEATSIYARHRSLYNSEASRFWRSCDSPFMFPDLHLSRSPDASRLINHQHSGTIIIAGSGMCEGGRIRHHLQHNLWRNNCHVIIVGYQVEGTLGRALVDGARTVELWEREVEVNAQIHAVDFSAHADQQGLIDWYSAIAKQPPLVLTHGEEDARQTLAKKLRKQDVDVTTPAFADTLNLETI